MNDPQPHSQTLSQEIVFHYGAEWFHVLGAVLVSAVILYILYRRLPKPIPNAYRYTLLALRVTWVLALLILFFQPTQYLVKEYVYGNYPDVRVLTDVSQSMGPEGTGSPARWNFVTEVIRKLKPQLEAIQELQINWDSIGEQWRPLQPDPQPNDQASHLARQIRKIADVSGTGNTFFLLLSDGGDTDDASAEEILPDLKRNHISVFPVIAEEPSNIKEIFRIEDLEYPPVVRPNETFQLNATLRARLFRPLHADLLLMRDGRILDRKSIMLDKEGLMQQAFRVTADTEKNVLPLSLRVVPKDSRFEAHTVPIEISVDKSRVVNVLMLQGALNWEMRFLSQAIHSNPMMKMDAISRLSEDRYYLQIENREASVQEGSLRKHFKRLDKRYDVIILANVDPQQISGSMQEELESFVNELGGGLLFISGNPEQSTRFAGTAFEKMLPVQFKKTFEPANASDQFARRFKNTVYDGNMFDNEDQFVERLMREENAKFYSKLKSLQLTAEAEESPIWKDAASKENQTLPEPPATYIHSAPAKAPKPAATVLAVGQKQKTETSTDETTPLFVVQPYGDGRVGFLGVDGLWRWRLEDPSEARHYDRFWQQFLLWLGIQAKGNAIATNQQLYPQDAVSRITVTTRDLEQLPELVAVYGEQKQKSIPVTWNRQTGMGQANWQLPDTDQVRFQLLSKKGVLASRLIQVRSILLEQEYAQLNTKFLERLAAETNGELLRGNQWERFPELLKQQQMRREFSSAQPLWRKEWIFILLLFAISAEWMLRRKATLF